MMLVGRQLRTMCLNLYHKVLGSVKVSTTSSASNTSTSTLDHHPHRLSIEELNPSSKINLPSSGSIKPFTDIPGPKGLPLFGTALEYLLGWNGLSFAKMFEAYKKRYETYGPIYKECFGHHTIVIVTDFKEYNKVIRADGRMPRRVPLEPLLTYRLRNRLETGLVNGNGDVWYKYRSSVNKKMLKPAEVTQYMDWMDDVALDMTQLIAETKNQDNVLPDLNDMLFRWSLESVTTFILDTRLGSLDIHPHPDCQKLMHNIIGVFECMQKLMYDIPLYKLLPTPMWQRFENHCAEAISMGLSIVNKRLEEVSKQGSDSHREGLISYLLANQNLSKFEIGVTLVELMVGSIETSANSLMWTLYLLSKDGKRQQLLYNEISSVLGDSRGNITPDMMNKLQYTKACIKEAMRLYPVTFATSRILNEDVEVCGYHIPKDTHIQANVCTLCRDPKIFSQPDSYIPERWLSNKNENMAVANLVWGHGARMCIGRRLAEQEMYLALARIIQKYHLVYPDTAGPEPVLHTVMTSSKHIGMKFIQRDIQDVNNAN